MKRKMETIYTKLQQLEEENQDLRRKLNNTKKNKKKRF